MPMVNSEVARHEPGDARWRDWKCAPRTAASAMSTITCRGADGQRDEQVAEHHERAVDGRGQQLPLRAGVAIDDHADAGEHAC